MKANANSAPITMFLVEKHPQVADIAIVTLYDNVGEPNSDGVYTYDVYQVTVPWRDDLTMRVATRTSDWLATAKSMDATQAVQEAADATIAENEAAIDELLLLIGGDA